MSENSCDQDFQGYSGKEYEAVCARASLPNILGQIGEAAVRLAYSRGSDNEDLVLRQFQVNPSLRLFLLQNPNANPARIPDYLKTLLEGFSF